ncbi:hypothetical protein RugamoR64_30610 [Duganella rhizosphaerae]|uniref:hypothetical protein n=1 Tax=Duganella rhizosphaerae TaxID=2885763 RepID=UPI0030E895B5
MLSLDELNASLALLIRTYPPRGTRIVWDSYVIGLTTHRGALMNKGAFMPKIEALLALLEIQ